MSKVFVKGVNNAIRHVNREYTRHRRIIKGRANHVGADLLKRARNNAPVQTGEHVQSMSYKVIDLGYGNGFLIEVTGGDTPYSLWLHEAHYTAHPPHGTSSFVMLTGGGRTLKIQGAIAMQSPSPKGTAYWFDSEGNMHGRKYLTRALDENRNKYERYLEKPIK